MPNFDFTLAVMILIGFLVLGAIGFIIFAAVNSKFRIADFEGGEKLIEDLNTIFDSELHKNSWKIDMESKFDVTIKHYPAGLPPGVDFQRVLKSAQKTWGSHTWTTIVCVRSDVVPTKLEDGWPFLTFFTKLNSSLPGWILVRPENSIWVNRQYGHKLEASDFNRKIDVRGTSNRLAFQVLSPDFMEWVYDQKPRPWITVEQDYLLVTYERSPLADGLADVEKKLSAILEFVEKSGALEKPATPA